MMNKRVELIHQRLFFLHSRLHQTTSLLSVSPAEPQVKTENYEENIFK